MQLAQRQGIGQQGHGGHVEIIPALAAPASIEAVPVEAAVPFTVQVQHPADPAEVGGDRFLATGRGTQWRPQLVEVGTGVAVFPLRGGRSRHHAVEFPFVGTIALKHEAE